MLGPLEVRAGDAILDLGRPKEPALLSILLLHPNEPVAVDGLLEALWPERDPAAARRSLEVHVSRVRSRLGRAESATRLTARLPGYVLRVDDGERDIDRFEALVTHGREELAGGDAVEAAVVLRDALALWRGTPLAEVGTNRSRKQRSLGLKSCMRGPSTRGSMRIFSSAATNS